MNVLDLRQLADEWQEVLDEYAPDEESDDEMPADVRAEMNEECKKYEDLCAELMITPAEPATLRWYADRQDPELIPDDEFEDYARQLAEDIGAIEEDGRWPTNCIDWEKAARELAMDYSSVTYDGDSYYTRG